MTETPVEGPQAAVSLQARLEGEGAPGDRDEPAGGPPPVTDPVALLRHLERSGRFRRDSGIGAIFHPGQLSFRETSPTDSLHLVVDGNHLAAHVDRVSPLDLRSTRRARYSFRQAAAHNLAGMAEDAWRLLRGRQGHHLSELECEWVQDPTASATPASKPGAERDGLLEPEWSAWSLQLEAQLSGSLEESRLRSALESVFGHPASHDLLDVVDCPDDATLDSARRQLQDRPVGVGDHPPLRARLARHPEGDVLMLNINHAACDGPRGLQVMQAIGRAYCDDATPGPVVDFLASHDLPVRPAPAGGSALMGRYRRMVERLRNLVSRPARLAPDSAADDPGCGFHLASMPVDHEATDRKLLMGALHLAIDEWNRDHGTASHRIGVLASINLGPPNLGPPGGQVPVANLSVTARVSTSRRHRHGPGAVREAMTAQSSRNSRTRSGVALIEALERSGMLDLWAKQSLVVLQPVTSNQLVDIALLAGLGSLEAPSFGPDAGDVRHLWFSIPARSPMTLCIGVVTVPGRLDLVVRYPYRLFGPDAARRFTDGYLTQVRRVAEDVTRAGAPTGQN